MDRYDYLNATARSVAFLSRLPVPPGFLDDDDGRLAGACRAFPLAGLVIGALPAAAFAVLIAIGAPALVGGFLVTALFVVVTGGLHEDGLADTADGFGAKGDRDHRLAVMRDSRTGVFGALALILAVGLRASALAALSAGGALAGAFAVLAVAAASRAAMGFHWQALEPARPDGLAVAAGRPEPSAARQAALIGGVLMAVLAGFGFGLLAMLLALAAMALSTMAMNRIVERHFGGNTGDTIGATQQICETAGLAALAVAL